MTFTAATVSRVVHGCETPERVRTLAVVPLVVDQLALGPIGTNCYLVRADRAATEAVVVDPSGDAPRDPASARRRRRALRRDPRHARALRPHPRPRRARRGHRRARPRSRRRSCVAIEHPARSRRRGSPSAPCTPDVLLEGGETLELGRDRVRRASPSPATRPATSPTRVDGELFSGDVLFAGSVGRTDLPGRRLGRRCSTSIAAPRRRASRRRPSCIPATARRRRSAPSSRRNPFLAELGVSGDSRMSDRPRSSARAGRTTSSRPRCRSWQRVTGEIERLCALYGYRRILTPVLRGHGALRPHVGRGLRRRAEGDVHLHRPLGPLAHAAAGGHRADLPRLRRARHAPRPAAGEALHDRADVPLRRARAGPLPRALAGLRRGDRDRRPGDRRRADPALRHAARTASASRATTSSSTRSAAASCRPAYLDALRALARRRTSAGSTTRRGPRSPSSPLRVFDNYLAKPAAVREALDEAPKIGESLCDACVAHFARSAGRPRRDGRRLHARPDARARPRLLHAHDLGVHRADGEPELDDLRRRPLRRPRRGDRRAADARRRLRRRHRAAADRDGGGGRRTAEAPPIDVFFALDEGAPRERIARLARRAAARGRRCRHRLRGPLAQGPAHAGAAARCGDDRRSSAPTARRCERPGRPTRQLGHAEIVG